MTVFKAIQILKKRRDALEKQIATSHAVLAPETAERLALEAAIECCQNYLEEKRSTYGRKDAGTKEEGRFSTQE